MLPLDTRLLHLNSFHQDCNIAMYHLTSLESLQVHPGDTITCLQADCDSSHQRNKRTDNPGGWVVVSGDRKGLVIISWGDFSLPPSAHDSASEEEGSGKHPNYTLKKRDSHSAGQRLSSQQPRPQQMAVRSVPVTVLVGKGEISCLTLTRKQGRVFGRSQWDLMAVGTSTGRIALVDVLEGKVSDVTKESQTSIPSCTARYAVSFNGLSDCAAI